MKKRVFFNEDGDHFGFCCYKQGIDVTKKVLLDFIDQYKNTDITDLSVCLNGVLSSADSDIFETMADRYEITYENGKAVNYKNTHVAFYYDIYRNKKLDMYQIWVQRLWEIGIRPWLSFRMNDCHCLTQDVNVIKGKRVEAHPEWWITQNRPAVNYFDKALNYLNPEVQKYVLDYLEEQLLKYDVYGVELDFNREPYCFPAGAKQKGRKEMISFLEKCKMMIDRVAKQRGKEIKINLLCQANPITAYENGFDMAEIAGRGLVDMVVACPRWETMNNDIPVRIWKQLLGDKVEFACKQELLMQPSRGYRYKSRMMATASLEVALGQAAAFDAMGTDVTYLYNYMIFPGFEEDPADEVILIQENSVISEAGNSKVLKTIGHIDEVNAWTCRYPLTYDDFTNLSDKIHSRLPEEVKPESYSYLKIATGKVIPGQKTYVIIGTADEINPCMLDIYANDQKAQYVKEGKEDRGLFDKNIYTFEFSAEIDDCVEISIMSKEECRIEYAEILVEALK